MIKIRGLGRSLAALLCLATLFFTVSCGKTKNYKPVKSSAEEREAMATLSGGETVRYELLRAFLYALQGEYDGGDPSLWTGEDGAARFAELTGEAMARVSEIYATLAVCKKYGIDPNGKKVNAEVERRVRADIDGGLINDTLIEGYGSKKKYLAALERMHLNDSVNRLLHRYDVCLSMLYKKLVSEFNGGANSATREEVEAFYYSEDCAQISWLFISSDTLELYDREGAEDFILRAYGKLLEARADYSEMQRVIAGYTFNLSYDQIENGFCISRFGGVGSGARELAEAAFSLSHLEISERVTTEDGVYYLVGLTKSAEYFADPAHYELLHDLCLANRLYRELDEKADALLRGAAFTDAYRALDPAALFARQ